MRRNNLVDADNLVNGIAVAALIVLGLHRLRNLTLLQVLDSRIVLRLQLVNLEIRRTGIRVSHLTAVGLRLRVLRIELRSKLERHSVILNFRLQRIESSECFLPVLVCV